MFERQAQHRELIVFGSQVFTWFPDTAPDHFQVKFSESEFSANGFIFDRSIRLETSLNQRLIYSICHLQSISQNVNVCYIILKMKIKYL